MTIAENKVSGKSKGFAKIEFAEEGCAAKALEGLNGTPLAGTDKPMVVAFPRAPVPQMPSLPPAGFRGAAPPMFMPGRGGIPAAMAAMNPALFRGMPPGYALAAMRGRGMPSMFAPMVPGRGMMPMSEFLGVRISPPATHYFPLLQSKTVPAPYVSGPVPSHQPRDDERFDRHKRQRSPDDGRDDERKRHEYGEKWR